MINNFPAEIIVIVLRNLGIYDLINITKANRRLWNISKSPKTPLRHLLQIRTAKLSVSLISPIQSEDDNDEEEHLFEDPYLFCIKYFDSDERAKDSTKKDSFRIDFVTKCCSSHYNADREYTDGEEWESPSHLVRCAFDAQNTDDFLKLKYKNHNAEKTIEDFLNTLYLITNYCAKVNDFELIIEHSTQIWYEKIVKFFENNKICAGRPKLTLSGVNIHTNRFFASRFFERGLEEVYYCQVIEEGLMNYFVPHEKVVNAKVVQIKSGSPIMKNKHLLLFKNAEKVILDKQDEVNPIGIANLVKASNF